jgi:RNA polymerase sigma-70 factor (ECF subfamily)
MADGASNIATDKISRPAGDASPIDLDEPRLVERCRQGDAEAFSVLVHRYQHRVYGMLVRMVGKDDAEELAQEAFLKALEHIKSFRGGCRFYTWLYRIATNLALSHRRRGATVRFVSLQSKSAGREDDMSEAMTEREAIRKSTPPDAGAIANEQAGRITEALDALEEEFRPAVILRDLQNLDYATIAEILDLPVGTVKSRIHRGRMILREKLRGLDELP